MSSHPRPGGVPATARTCSIRYGFAVAKPSATGRAGHHRGASRRRRALIAVALLGVWQYVLDQHDPADEPPATADEDVGPRTNEEAASDPVQPVPAQLPRDTRHFTGRQDALHTLRSQIAATGREPASPATTVPTLLSFGPPGFGKSALAVQVAHQLREAFLDGQLYVNLRGAERDRLAPAAVLGQFLRALGLPEEDVPTDLGEQVARYRTLMWGRRILVLLDDAANAAQVEPLLPASPTCAVLIASRDVLKDLDGVHRERLKVLEPNAATELLGKFVGPERVAREPEAANAIAGYCDNMPLALRIAGAKLAARPDNWSLATLAGTGELRAQL